MFVCFILIMSVSQAISLFISYFDSVYWITVWLYEHDLVWSRKVIITSFYGQWYINMFKNSTSKAILFASSSFKLCSPNLQLASNWSNDMIWSHISKCCARIIKPLLEGWTIWNKQNQFPKQEHLLNFHILNVIPWLTKIHNWFLNLIKLAECICLKVIWVPWCNAEWSMIYSTFVGICCSILAKCCICDSEVHCNNSW